MKLDKRILTLVLFILIILAFAVGSWFIHPIGPVLVAVFILVQLPLIIRIVKAGFGESYVQRQEKRRQAHAEGSLSAEEWLRQELAETQATGFDRWSLAGRSLNALNRAEALLTLGRQDEAGALLFDLKAENLPAGEGERLTRLLSSRKADTAE